MTRRTDSNRSRRVAVGTSRAHASQVFGELHDELFLTTYDELGTEVDLTGPAYVELAASPEAAPVLRTLLDAVDANHELRVRVELGHGDAAGLLDLLGSHPGIGIEEVSRLGAGVAVGLTQMGPDASSASLLALDALDLPPTTDGQSTAVLPETADAGYAGAAAASTLPPARRRPPPPTPPPAVVRVLDQVLRKATADGRRSRTSVALLAGAAGAVVLAVVLVAIGLSPWGVAGVLVVLGLLCLAALGALLVLLLMLQRDLYHHHRTFETMLRRQGRQMRRRTDQLSHQQTVLRRGQADLPFLRQYVEALDASSSALRAQLTDWFEHSPDAPRRPSDGADGGTPPASAGPHD